MLFPQTNARRTVLDISGLWEIKVDENKTGESKGWEANFESDSFIAVPGSWNEQLAEFGLLNYVGTVWYKKDFFIPKDFSDKQVVIRFGSADHHAKVWINGEFAGQHSGGFLPFEIDITKFVNLGKENRVVVAVNNELSHDTIPQGLSSEDFKEFNRGREETYPATAFDFFVYGGIHRAVKILAMSKKNLTKIELDTEISGSNGLIKMTAHCNSINEESVHVVAQVWDGDSNLDTIKLHRNDQCFEGKYEILNCKFWNPDNPHLYTIKFELYENNTVLDEYRIDTGVREITVTEDQILLNGEPVFLKGFGKHEDFAIIGKGFSYPLLIKDFQLMKWMGANSFRTSHYPYAEEVLQLADKMGFLVIDECAAVSLNFRYVSDKTRENHKSALSKLVARDRNHPCVICWDIANEPGIWMEPEAVSEKAETYWEEIYNHVKELDPSRPISLPTFSRIGLKDPGNKFCDLISINRYWGWYELPADLEKAGDRLRNELNELHGTFKKPILVSEFGADAIEGAHSTTPQLFTEEYQTLFIKKYFDIIESLPFTVGEHIWNFADFKTAQHHRRVVLNKKGVFNRQREPKAAAFMVREHWLSNKK